MEIPCKYKAQLKCYYGSKQPSRRGYYLLGPLNVEQQIIGHAN